jgi:MFS transporter, PPP family, 3-phenylpropionic acid transporter
MRSKLRLGLFYFAVFLGTGANTPYISLFFAEHGLSGSQIGVILSAPMLARAFTGPAVAVWADGFVLRRTPIILLALAGLVFYSLTAMAHGFWPWLLLWFAASTAYAALQPLADVIALRRSRLEGFNYGAARSFGSISFILASFGCGALLSRTGSTTVVVWTACAAALSALAASRLPADAVRQDDAPALGRLDRWRGAGRLLRDRRFLLCILSAGCVLAGQAFYYGFATLIWRRQGLSESLIGALWAVGVMAEIGFMWALGHIGRRIGPATLLGFGAALAIVRWTAYAFTPPAWLLFPLQAFHAGSFAMAWIASLRLAERVAPPDAASAAQMLNSAIPTGLMIGLATLSSGPLFDAVGAYGYLAMAAMAVVGLVGSIFVGRTLKNMTESSSER